MRGAVALVFLGVGLASCVTKPEVKAEEPAAAPLTAKESVLKLTRDFYAAIAAQETERLSELVTPDALSFGVGPADTFIFRDTLLARIRQDVTPVGFAGDVLVVSPGPLLVGLAKSEQSAWVYDAPSVTVSKASAPGKKWAARLTAHAVVEEGRWRFDALHVSMAVEDADLNAPDALKRFAAPPDLLEEKGAGADVLADTTKRIMEDIVVKLMRLSNRDEVALIGTGPTEVYLGGKAFKDLVRPNLAELKKAVFTLKLDGPVRARVAPDGETGWVGANVILRQQVGRKMVTFPTFRMLWVLEKTNEGWSVVQEHQSVGLKPEQRAASVANGSANQTDGGLGLQK